MNIENKENDIHPSVIYGFNKIEFICPKCNWKGFGIETIDIGMSEYTIYDVGCPECGSMQSLGYVMFDSDIGKNKFHKTNNS
jgi:predicted RNA-binding Zn-ribbon protein involved in translation (DUF1610 family)